MSCLSKWTGNVWRQGLSIHFFEKWPDQWLNEEVSDGSPFPTPWTLLVACIQQYTKRRAEYSKLLLSLTLPHLIPTLPLLPPYSPLSMKFKVPLLKTSQWLPITFMEETFSFKSFSGFSSHLEIKTQACYGLQSFVDWVLPCFLDVFFTIRSLFIPLEHKLQEDRNFVFGTEYIPSAWRKGGAKYQIREWMNLFSQ